MAVVSSCRKLLSIVGLYGRISRGLRGGGLPCGGCQRFESAYLQLVNLADTKLYDSIQFFRFGSLIYAMIYHSWTLIRSFHLAAP
ncbi:hypothetical protein RIF29_43204 [Crotalaria pallida]|uniref:Uncharacterized protein n=1 Tax=Crotalaria pallida TaxID=3830 RepID=A0AAN9DWX8_CROPI